MSMTLQELKDELKRIQGIDFRSQIAKKDMVNRLTNAIKETERDEVLKLDKNIKEKIEEGKELEKELTIIKKENSINAKMNNDEKVKEIKKMLLEHDYDHDCSGDLIEAINDVINDEVE